VFIGHFGVGFAGKKVAPSVSLGTLFLAAQFADLLWPVLLLAGVEHFRITPGITKVSPFDFYDYPISHSLLALVGWGAVLGGAYLLRRNNLRGALVVAAAVVSHWVLDFVVHRPDMPVLPGREYLGLGLWNSVPATVLAEVGVYGGGLALYLAATKANDRVGVWALWTLVVFLFVLWIASLVGPAPPDVKPVTVAGLAMWLTVPWAYWIDRHRRPR
jgi:hypothetical protein